MFVLIACFTKKEHDAEILKKASVKIYFNSVGQ